MFWSSAKHVFKRRCICAEHEAGTETACTTWGSQHDCVLLLADVCVSMQMSEPAVHDMLHAIWQFEKETKIRRDNNAITMFCDSPSYMCNTPCKPHSDAIATAEPQYTAFVQAMHDEAAFSAIHIWQSERCTISYSDPEQDWQKAVPATGW